MEDDYDLEHDTGKEKNMKRKKLVEEAKEYWYPHCFNSNRPILIIEYFYEPQLINLTQHGFSPNIELMKYLFSLRQSTLGIVRAFDPVWQRFSI